MSSFSRSYARALVQAAPRGEDVAALLDGAAAIARAIASNPRLKEFFASPAIPKDVKQKALESLAVRAGLDAFALRFLALVLANRRLLHLQEIVDSAREELDRAQGVARAHVVVAAPVGPQEEGRIAAALTRSLGQNVRVRVAVDDSILGGFVAKVGSRVIDASVASAIARFQERTKARA